MKIKNMVLITTACLIYCTITSCKPDAPVAPEENLVTIKYVFEPIHTFEIAGTDIKGLELEELPEALKKHHKEHPAAIYELYSELKCVPETSDEIIETIKDTGVTLKHYWAPISVVDFDRPPGKYGHGHVDIIGQ